jgi:hypothetical protein
VFSLTAIWLMAVLTGARPWPQAPAPAPPQTAAPEVFDVTATAKAGPAAAGTLTVPIAIRVDRYTSATERAKMIDGLKYNGYPGFLRAVRDAPAAGSLQVGDQSFVIRWARQEPAGAGRTITLVTDKPVYFIGSGGANAKPKAGYEVAVVTLNLDAAGHGDGTMAAAARVKPRGTTGFVIDDYAETPLKLSVAVHSGR